MNKKLMYLIVFSTSLTLNIYLLITFSNTNLNLKEKSKPSPNQIFHTLDIAKESLVQGEFEECYLRFINALNKTEGDPDYLNYIWNEIEENRINISNKEINFEKIVKTYLNYLDSTISRTQTDLDFKKLYDIRKRILKINENIIGKKETRITNNNPEIEPDRLMKEGLKYLKENDLNRAEYMIQAAIRSQTINPAFSPTLWMDYKKYLNSVELEDYDKISRLNVYLEKIEETLTCSNNRFDFEKAWETRKDILEEKKTSEIKAFSKFSNLLIEIEKKIVKSIEESRSLSQIHDGLRFDKNLLAYFDTLDFKTNNSFSTKVYKSLINILENTKIITEKKITQLQKELDEETKTDHDYDSTVEPTDSEKRPGNYEKILDRTKEIMKILDTSAADSLIEIVNLFEKNNIVNTSSNQSKLQNEFKKFFITLNDIDNKTNQMQLLRYNLWALRRIYSSEKNPEWYIELGKIDTNLLHPAVNSLYSMTYDSLIKTQTEPQIRTGIVQRLLNSKKISLSQF